MNRRQAEGIPAMCHYCFNPSRTFKLNQQYLVCADCIKQNALWSDNIIEAKCHSCGAMRFVYECSDGAYEGNDRVAVCEPCMYNTLNQTKPVNARDVVLREIRCRKQPDMYQQFTYQVALLIPISRDMKFRETAVDCWNDLRVTMETHNSGLKALQADQGDIETSYSDDEPEVYGEERATERRMSGPREIKGLWNVNQDLSRFRAHMHECMTLLLPLAFEKALAFEEAGVLGNTKGCPCIFAKSMDQWFVDRNIDRKKLCLHDDDFDCNQTPMTIGLLRTHLDEKSLSCPAHFLVKQYLVRMRGYFYPNQHLKWESLGREWERELGSRPKRTCWH